MSTVGFFAQPRVCLNDTSAQLEIQRDLNRQNRVGGGPIPHPSSSNQQLTHKTLNYSRGAQWGCCSQTPLARFGVCQTRSPARSEPSPRGQSKYFPQITQFGQLRVCTCSGQPGSSPQERLHRHVEQTQQQVLSPNKLCRSHVFRASRSVIFGMSALRGMAVIWKSVQLNFCQGKANFSVVTNQKPWCQMRRQVQINGNIEMESNESL